ncbi:hypothetical protein HNY73_021169 [Argiope bruennichi]|uniref:Uncharacterized protein n=1 Tax=Argiope bruennichi TaxID=94029 RepID=A0A8T0EA53_ARGBR|nr:hypothetical protein HNY73_021169 [Argiope bruennichi]
MSALTIHISLKISIVDSNYPGMCRTTELYIPTNSRTFAKWRDFLISQVQNDGNELNKDVRGILWIRAVVCQTTISISYSKRDGYERAKNFWPSDSKYSCKGHIGKSWPICQQTKMFRFSIFEFWLVDLDSELPTKLRRKRQQWNREAEDLTKIKIPHYDLDELNPEVF